MINKHPLAIKAFFIYFSMTIIIILLIYGCTNNYNEKYIYKAPNGNAVSVSPLTGKEINQVLNNRSAYMATFTKEISILELSEKLQWDIILESYNHELNKCVYKALYHSNSPFNIREVEKTTSIPVASLPAFQFEEVGDKLPIYYKTSGDHITIRYSPETATTFIYEQGVYKYIYGASEGYGPSVANIIIQLVKGDDTMEKGNCIVISGGKACSGIWYKYNDITTIKDYLGRPMTLMTGKSWWLTVEQGRDIIIE